MGWDGELAPICAGIPAAAQRRAGIHREASRGWNLVPGSAKQHCRPRGHYRSARDHCARDDKALFVIARLRSSRGDPARLRRIPVRCWIAASACGLLAMTDWETRSTVACNHFAGTDQNKCLDNDPGLVYNPCNTGKVGHPARPTPRRVFYWDGMESWRRSAPASRPQRSEEPESIVRHLGAGIWFPGLRSSIAVLADTTGPRETIAHGMTKPFSSSRGAKQPWRSSKAETYPGPLLDCRVGLRPPRNEGLGNKKHTVARRLFCRDRPKQMS